MSMVALLALFMALQDFNPGNDPDRSIGEYKTRRSSLGFSPEPLLSTYGNDAIRFTSKPELLGGAGNVITLTPDRQGHARATVTMSGLRCPANKKAKCFFERTRGPSFAFCVEGDCSYRGVAAQVRALLFDPARMPNTGALGRTVCFDGPGFVTELREGGQTHNLSGFCGKNHPNNAIYALIRKGAGDRWPGLGEN